MIYLLCYNLLIVAFSPLILAFYIIRVFSKKDTLSSFLQKFALISVFLPKKRYDIWLHAASVGEVKSLDFIIKKCGDKKILITTTTLKSAEVVPRHVNITHKFLPLDFPLFLWIFFIKNQAMRIIVAESEIWPNFFTMMRLFKKNTTLFNARISKNSQKKWNMIPNFLHFLLKFCNNIVAQSELTQKFLQQFHSRVAYFGNLKILNLQNHFENNKIIEQFCRNSKILCVASTHDGEDIGIIKQILNFQNQFKILYIPRHPHRSQEISRLLIQNGIENTLYSSKISNKSCLVVDKIGIMQTALMFSEIVIFGGSFLPHLKGHNILEAGVFGCKILTGHFVETFQQIIDEMVLCNGIVQCNLHEISQKIEEINQFEIGKNAQKFIERNTPSEAQILEFLQL